MQVSENTEVGLNEEETLSRVGGVGEGGGARTEKPWSRRRHVVCLVSSSFLFFSQVSLPHE